MSLSTHMILREFCVELVNKTITVNHEQQPYTVLEQFVDIDDKDKSSYIPCISVHGDYYLTARQYSTIIQKTLECGMVEIYELTRNPAITDKVTTFINDNHHSIETLLDIYNTIPVFRHSIDKISLTEATIGRQFLEPQPFVVVFDEIFNFYSNFKHTHKDSIATDDLIKRLHDHCIEMLNAARELMIAARHERFIPQSFRFVLNPQFQSTPHTLSIEPVEAETTTSPLCEYHTQSFIDLHPHITDATYNTMYPVSQNLVLGQYERAYTQPDQLLVDYDRDTATHDQCSMCQQPTETLLTNDNNIIIHSTLYTPTQTSNSV